MTQKYPVAGNVKFILCEDVRMEAHQKLTLLGVFPADSITVLNPKEPPGGSGVAVLTSLTVVAVLKQAQGRFDARLRIVAPGGTAAFDEHIGAIELPKRGAATLAAKAMGFVVPAFGSYRAELQLDEKVYPFPFEILADAGAGQGSTASSAPQA